MSREMKESGIDWIGKIPSHWDILRGKVILTKLSRPILDSDKVVTCFRDGEVTLRSNRREDGFTMADKEIGYQGVEPGDLVVHGMDGFAGAIGISDSRGKSSPVLNVLESKQNKKYLMYYLRSMAYSDVFLAIATGIRVRSCDLRWNKIGELPYPIPPIDEQKLIARKLDFELGCVNSIIEQTQSTIEEYKLLKQSLITEAVTKGLDKNVEMKDSGIEWIGNIPKHWNVMKIKYAVKIRDEKDEYDASKDCFIGLENIASQSGQYIVTDTRYDSGLNPIFKKDDILFGKLRPYLAKCIRADFSGFCTGELLVIKDFIGNKRFLQLYLLSPIFIDQVNSSTYGTKMPRANWNFIKELEIPIPPVEEQNNIEDYFDQKLKEIDNLIEAKESLVTDLEVYKKSLIYEYVTGKKEIK